MQRPNMKSLLWVMRAGWNLWFSLLLFAADHSPDNPTLRCSRIVSATTRQRTRLTHLGRLSVTGNVGKTQCYLARKAYSLFHRLQTGLKIIPTENDISRRMTTFPDSPQLFLLQGG